MSEKTSSTTYAWQDLRIAVFQSILFTWAGAKILWGKPPSSTGSILIYTVSEFGWNTSDSSRWLRGRGVKGRKTRLVKGFWYMIIGYNWFGPAISRNSIYVGVIEIIEPLIHQQHYAARNSGTTCRGSRMRRQFWSRRDTGAREEPSAIQVVYLHVCLCCRMLPVPKTAAYSYTSCIYIIYIHIYIYDISSHRLVAINMGTL